MELNDIIIDIPLDDQLREYLNSLFKELKCKIKNKCPNLKNVDQDLNEIENRLT